ncbi:MAG: hypothetical protein JXX28_11675, partial [Deltaproteobacteria bacterium]|nr:hypothetical protein [Deltaproteobacteria bacterium]
RSCLGRACAVVCFKPRKCRAGEWELIGALRSLAGDYLHDQGKLGRDYDVMPDWFALEQVLEEPAFVEHWKKHGRSHRWKMHPPLPPPWRIEQAPETVDHLDLLRYLFVHYFSGLPVRGRWSPKKDSWFIPEVEQEEPWRLFFTAGKPHRERR